MLYTRGEQEASGLACLCEREVKKLKTTAGGHVRAAALSQLYHTCSDSAGTQRSTFYQP